MVGCWGKFNVSESSTIIHHLLLKKLHRLWPNSDSERRCSKFCNILRICTQMSTNYCCAALVIVPVILIKHLNKIVGRKRGFGAWLYWIWRALLFLDPCWGIGTIWRCSCMLHGSQKAKGNERTKDQISPSKSFSDFAIRI